MVCFEFFFVLVWIHSVKYGKNALFMFQPDASPLRRRSACLGEGMFSYVNPRPSFDPCLLRLGEGMLCLGKPLRLGEPIFLASFVLASSLLVFLSIFIMPK